MSAPEPVENPLLDVNPSKEGPSAPFNPEDLPPVEPPSAGFILQLFVVPALIVGTIIGVWLLFGRSVASDQNWERQIGELRSENDQRRWRGANTLVQMLQADAQAGEQSQNLRTNPELAEKLGGVLKEQIAKGDSSEANRKVLAYLIMSLGWLDAHDATVPLLIELMGSLYDTEIRQNAITSLTLIAGRQFEAGTYLDRPDVTEALLTASQDTDPRIRQRAVYSLGLLAPEVGGQRVRTMLEDGDEFVRVNAAIALARSKSTDGLDVLEAILNRAINEPSPLDQLQGSDQNPESVNEANAHEIELRLMTLNALQAIEELSPQLSASERERLTPLVDSLADNFRDVKIVKQAHDVRKSFK